MEEFNHNKWDLLKRELTRLFFISVGIFLFILFFQPFPLESLEYNDRLLYVTGFGLISFILSFIVLVLLQLLFPKIEKLNQPLFMPPLILSISLLALTMTAYTFYIRFVGGTYITTYIIFKIFLVCLLPIIILGILFKNKSLELVIEVLQKQNKVYLEKLRHPEIDTKEETVELLSENKYENLNLLYKDIIAIKSADNYIKVHFLKDGNSEMKIIRNTLKSIEQQLTKRSEFLRCHRTSIVNINLAKKLVKSYNGYNLIMHGFKEEIAVSRQYLIVIKEAISAR